MFDAFPLRLSCRTFVGLACVWVLPDCGGQVAGVDVTSTGGTTGYSITTGLAAGMYTVAVPPVGGASVTYGGASTVGNAGGYAIAGAIASTGGSSDTGGTSSTSVDCRTVDCEFPVCADGYTSVTLSGYCCPSCIANEPACQSVICATPYCPNGYTVGREPGACCDTCIATATATKPNCTADKCSTPTSCSPGYVVTNTPWTCCPTCAPDPNYCETDSDCILAKDAGCCSCTVSISTRRYAADPCYSVVGSPRVVPASCAPQSNCDMPCYACAPNNYPVCTNQTCSAVYDYPDN